MCWIAHIKMNRFCSFVVVDAWTQHVHSITLFEVYALVSMKQAIWECVQFHLWLVKQSFSLVRSILSVSSSSECPRRGCKGRKKWDKKLASVVRIDELYKHVSVHRRMLCGYVWCCCCCYRRYLPPFIHLMVPCPLVMCYTYHGIVMVATRLNSNKLSRCQ